MTKNKQRKYSSDEFNKEALKLAEKILEYRVKM